MAVASACSVGASCGETQAPAQADAANGAGDDAASDDSASEAADAQSEHSEPDAAAQDTPEDVPERVDAGQDVLDASASAPDATQAADDAGPADAATQLPGPWVPLTCAKNGEWPFDTIAFSRPVDYLAQCDPVYSAEQLLLPDPGPPTVRPITLIGSACDSASDKAACEAAIERQLAMADCPVTTNICPSFLLVRSGDTVTRVQGTSDLAALLGRVDTAVEAALVTYMAHESLMCFETFLRDGGAPWEVGSRIRAIDIGYEVETNYNCYGVISTARTLVSRAGDINVLSRHPFCLGRRPAGLAPAAPCANSSDLGAYFARATQLEAASVFAFEQLARDLARLGAPSELIAFARRSAHEEATHTQMMGGLAQRFGAELEPARITPAASRDALAIAIENAVEGCVRETYGAALACYQAETAQDPAVRAVMARVFEDETKHAQLAWEIAAWLEPQLADADREAVQHARSAAYAQLRSEIETSLSQEARARIGMPSVAVGARLLAQLDQALALQAA
ncbi:MAG TPA: hypothetical protein VMF89_24885 [Polyangiales bacterium]|nr:hypothetical protein [Polyangiales bacterium]